MRPPQPHRTGRSRRSLPAHHLYVCTADSTELARHLAFRDALRDDPELASAYASLKRTLAERFADDRDGYTSAKSAFVERVLAEATG